MLCSLDCVNRTLYSIICFINICTNILSYDSGQCNEVMINGNTDTNSVAITASVSSEKASAALGGSGDAFSVVADPSTYVFLTVGLISTSMPKITEISFQVSGITEVYYVLSGGSTSVTSEPRKADTFSTITVFDPLATPVQANEITVYLKPGSMFSAVTVSGLYVKACFQPGI